MKAFFGKATIGYCVEVDDNATIEEVKARLASGMGRYYFSNFESEDIFDVKEIPWETYIADSEEDEEEE